MYVRIIKAFSYKNEHGEKVTAPRGWIGDLPDKHGEEAKKGGFAVDGLQRSSPSAEAEIPASTDGLDDKSKADLEALAKEKGVDISAARTKADIITALRAA
ncbi:hypothetical protein [Methylobacterium sp. 77]|uniref:hypothetical protein n=1 Tax=Methylobacterium sp. 77 TaxID=1101192 RepID=UPI00035E0CB2|nr:hypothetical protein [Methylobacterium sp. 77]